MPKAQPNVPEKPLSPGKMKTWLTNLEVVPSKATCSWRFNERIRRQVQVNVERLAHCDEGSKKNVSLHCGKFEFVEEC